MPRRIHQSSRYQVPSLDWSYHCPRSNLYFNISLSQALHFIFFSYFVTDRHAKLFEQSDQQQSFQSADIVFEGYECDKDMEDKFKEGIVDED